MAYAGRPVFAILPSLGWQEMFLLLVLGLLLYGRNLPEAGRSLGRVVAQLRRSFHDFKDQIDRDGEIRDVKKAIQDTAREVKGVAAVPRAVANPGTALRELTHEAMSSRLPEETPPDDPDPADDAEPSAPAGDAGHTANGEAGRRDPTTPRDAPDEP